MIYDPGRPGFTSKLCNFGNVGTGRATGLGPRRPNLTEKLRDRIFRDCTASALYFAHSGGRASPTDSVALVAAALVVHVALDQEDPASPSSKDSTTLSALVVPLVLDNQGPSSSRENCEFRFCRDRVICDPGRPTFTVANRLDCIGAVLCTLRRQRITNMLLWTKKIQLHLLQKTLRLCRHWSCHLSWTIKAHLHQEKTASSDFAVIV